MCPLCGQNTRKIKHLYKHFVVVLADSMQLILARSDSLLRSAGLLQVVFLSLGQCSCNIDVTTVCNEVSHTERKD